MGMATYTDPTSHLSKWQRRMKRAGYIMFRGKRPEDMSEAECVAAFDYLSSHCGISYTWHDQ